MDLEAFKAVLREHDVSTTVRPVARHLKIPVTTAWRLLHEGHSPSGQTIDAILLAFPFVPYERLFPRAKVAAPSTAKVRATSSGTR
jgi:hypothetical protein